MKWSAALFFLLALPFPAFAEAVSVVSGEHDGYTRLVFEVTPDREWRLDTGQSSAKLVFIGQDLEFEDGEVFARIPRTRLIATRLEQRDGVKEYIMDLACECTVRAFPYLDAYIVVDITGPTETTIVQPALRHFVPRLSAATMPDRNYGPPELVSWAAPQAPRYVDSPHHVRFPTQTYGVGLTPIQIPDLPPETSYSDVGQSEVQSGKADEIQGAGQELIEAVDLARNSLLRQLALAADQGLLNLNGPIPEILQGAEIPQEPEHEVIVEEFFDIAEELEDKNQMLIQSAVSRDALAARRAVEPQKENCPPPENLDIASWGSGDNFFAELSQARQGLLKEFDEPDYSAIERLVRTYLRYGFGAEAKEYLLESGQNIAQKALLLDLAAIVDGQSTQPEGPLSYAIGCDGLVGLWALVGAHPSVDGRIGDKVSVIATFADQPPDIRRLIGPKLASALLDKGYDATARQVSDILERAPGNHGTAHELVVGNLMQIEGRSIEAGAVYEDLTEANSKVAADALIELARLGLLQDQPPPRHLLMDLGSTAQIWRGSTKGVELRQLEALWLAKLGKADDAIDLLITEMQRDQENANLFRQTAEDILSALSVSENLVNNYAEIVHSYSEQISEAEKGDKLRLEISAKLLMAGLPDYAIEILAPVVKRGTSEAISLAAKANILAYRPDVALLLLNGITGNEAEMMRVEALLGEENFEQALRQLDQSAEISDATIAPEWFKGDWANAISAISAAATISERFFPDIAVSLHPSKELLPSDSFNLSAMEELLAKSQFQSETLEKVLLQHQ